MMRTRTTRACSLPTPPSGGGYRDIVMAAVTVTVADDDAPGVTLSVSTLEIPEGESRTYTVRLDTQPSSVVHIEIQSQGDADITVRPARLTIAPGAWNRAQTVTVSVREDPDLLNGTARVSHIASSTDPAYSGPMAGELLVTEIDNDEPEVVTITFSRALYRAWEGGPPVAILVRIHPQADRDIEVPLLVRHQDGASPQDYAGVPRTVRFRVGVTELAIQVIVSPDTVDDGGESILVSFGPLPPGVRAGELVDVAIHFHQERRADEFQPALSAGLAVVARTMAETARDAIQSRFQRRRHRSHADNNTYPMPTMDGIPQAGFGSSARPLSAGRLVSPLDAIPAERSFPSPGRNGPALPPRWTPLLWGSGDFQSIDADASGIAARYTGSSTLGQAGMDLYASDQVLIGLSFLRGWAQIDYRQFGVDGQIESRLSSVNPYAYWEPTRRVSVWAMGGGGSAAIDVQELARAHEVHGQVRWLSSGVRAALRQGTGIDLGLLADATHSAIRVPAQDDLPATVGTANQARVLLDINRNKALSAARSLAVQGELAARFDGGDSGGGQGGETTARIRYLDTEAGLDLSLHGRFVMFHSELRREWRIGIQLGWDPGAPYRGPRFSLATLPSRDAEAGLWHDSGPWGRSLRSASRTEGALTHVSGEFAYGLPGALWQISPFGRIHQGHLRGVEIGSRLRRRSDGSDLTIDLSGLRERRQAGDTDTRIAVRLSIPF